MVAPHLNLGYGGGSEKQIIELANGLALKGCKVTVLLTEKKGDLVPELSNGVKVVFHKPAGNFFSRLALIWKTAKANQTEILYSRLWKTKPAVIFAGKILAIKTVVAEDNNLRKKLNFNSRLFRLPARAAKSLCYKMADRVIAISEEGRKEIRDILGVEAQTVYNGIDTDRIRTLSEEEAEHRWFGESVPIAVAVGRIVPQKGYENLVEAISLANKTTPLRLLIIGGGELQNQISAKAREFGVEDRIDFTGAVHNPHKYTAKCDVFVCSSLFEGFGLVLAEALALGMPVVSTDYKHGAGEIIEDGKSGILVPVGDNEKMAEAILNLLENKPLAARMGEEAKKRAENFSVARMTGETLRIFRQAREKRI